MADDRIQLNLTLNEATVSAVEGRIRNLITRFNNEQINLTINSRSVDNAVNKLNNLISLLQRVNNTSTNVNASLTQQQQQYRLETERYRIQQRYEIARQRTLQTENQAITALARQNQTLTVNSTVTHQMNQEAQNLGNNMGVAGQHANNFTNYLANGVRYLAAYRSIEVVVNSFRDALSEMKNVDTALVAVKKTSGMSDTEINAIRKSAYNTASDYGRVASEYLNSVSEFARGGYKQQSTELAKVSMLTQNVGDVSQEASDKMLLAIDSAYQLKGNVTELTNVVNGLNNIANKNPTSMQKLSDGLQVSASMAQTTGLDISELVSLIGVGTSVTQREGAEISRAIRSMLMNISQVKGQLDDGEVIDSESIAKAQAALEGVGIETREVVNGVRELRNPMNILDELADKWGTLNTEAQSILLEDIGNKRHANILAGILSNWQMVEKMQDEYFNSANSAVEENQLYLESWEAKSARLNSQWTEYVSNIANTEVIKGSLDVLRVGISALDSPLGRVVTQIVLINTALAVTTRLWGAIRARSMIADIISLGVAEHNLGGAIQLVNGHLLEQATRMGRLVISNPVGQAGLTLAAIGLLVKGYDEVISKKEEFARAKLEEFDSEVNTYDEEIKSLEELQSKLQASKGNKAELAKIQNELNAVIGETAGLINGESTAYGVANAKLESHIKLKKQQAEQAKQEKMNYAKNLFDNNTMQVDGWFNLDATANQMRDWAKLYSGYVRYYNSLPSNNKSKKAFNSADEYAQSVFKSTLGEIDMELWSSYWNEQVQIAYDAFESTITDYSGAGGQDFVRRIIDNLVRSGSDWDEMNAVLSEVIDNDRMQKAIDIYWNSLVNPDINSEDTLKRVKSIIDDMAKKFPKLTDFFDTFYDQIASGGNAVSDATADMDKLNGSFDALEEKKAEYNKLTEEILNCTDAREKMALMEQQDILGDEISQIYEAIEGYENLTAAYEAYQKAKESPNSGSAYDSMTGELDNIKKQRQKGLVGTDDFREYTEFMTYGLTGNESVDELVNAFDTALPKFERYFTGESNGAKLFLQDLQALNTETKKFAEQNADGSWIANFDSAEIAENIGLSIAAVEAIMGKMSEYGIEINTTPALISLDDLKNAAQTAEEKLRILQQNGKMPFGFQTPDFNVESFDVKSIKSQISEAQALLNHFKKDDGSVDLTIPGAKELETILSALIRQKEKLSDENEISFMVKTEGKEDVIDLRDTLNSTDDRYVTLGAETKGQPQVNTLKSTIEETNSKDIQVSATTKGQDALTKMRDTIAAIKDKTVNIVTNTWKKIFGGNDSGNEEGDTGARGTAFHKGTALSKGNWGASKNGEALVGELGQELVVRDGKYFTVGDNGAEFFDYKKDDIVFNAEQTKQIFEKGKITKGNRRGKALAKGNAFWDGYNIGGKFYDEPSSSSSGSSSTRQTSSSSSKSKSTSKKSSGDKDALKDYLENAERLYKIHQNEMKYVNDLEYALNNLVSTEEERLDVMDTIEEARKEYAHNQIGDIEHQIELQKKLNGEQAIAIDNYYKIQEIAHAEANRLRSIGYDDNSDEIQELKDIWWDAEEKIKEVWYERNLDLNEFKIEMDRNRYGENADVTEYYKTRKEYHQARAEELRKLGHTWETSPELRETSLAWWEDEKSEAESRYSDSMAWIDSRNKFDDWDKYGDSEIQAYKRVLKYLREEYPEQLDLIKQAEEGLFDARKTAMEKELSDIDKYIDTRNVYNDWSNYRDNEVKAISDKIKVVKRYYEQGIISTEEYNEKIAEYEQNMYESMKQTTLDVLDLRSSQLDSLKTLTESYFDITNSIAEAQHEINKELATSKVMYEYLNEETRKLLFNQEDYDVLSEKLLDIQYEADKLQKKYNKEVRSATSENIAEITSQYQMQYETLMKSYEIAKADLEVAKKKQQLNNVLKERNTRMFINGRWQWVASTEDVQNALTEYNDAKYQSEQANVSLGQTESLNQLTKAQDILTTTINNIENGIVDFDEEIKTITEKLGIVSSKDVPALGYICTKVGKTLKDFVEDLTNQVIDSPISYSKDFDYSAAMEGLNKGSWKWRYLNEKRNAKIEGEGLNYNKYASGTKSASPGLAELGEDGYEIFINNYGHLIPIDQPTFADLQGGEIIFNQAQMKNLSELWDLSNFNRNIPSDILSNTRHQNTITNIDNSVHIDGVELRGQEAKDVINTLRRVVPNH